MEFCKDFFPLLKNHSDLVYLDSAATTPMLEAALDRYDFFCRYESAAVHRSFYSLAERATACFESVRNKTAVFFGIDTAEIVFTSGATAGCNAVAFGWLAHVLVPGDEIVVSLLEHHAAFLPFVEVARRMGATVRLLSVDQYGQFQQEDINTLINKRTRLVVCTAGSNVIGYAADFHPILARAKTVGAAFFLDGAQIAPRQRFDLERLGVDFFVCSAHKMSGPTGLGVLYVTKSRHSACHPWILGGSMVREVHGQEFLFTDMPWMWEAGTPPIQQVIAFEAVLDFLTSIDFGELHKHEACLTKLFLDGISDISRVIVLGDRTRLSREGHLVSFYIKDLHAHDVAFFLAQKNIAVRSGYHCAQPLHETLGVPQTVRASWYLYTQKTDVKKLVDAIRELIT